MTFINSDANKADLGAAFVNEYKKCVWEFTDLLKAIEIAGLDKL